MPLRACCALLALLGSASRAGAQDAQPPAGGTSAPANVPEARTKPQWLQDRVSYAFGVNLVRVARENRIGLNEEYFIAGVRDALYGRELLLTPEEMREALAQHERYLAKKLEERAALGERNRRDAEEFLSRNRTRDGVVTLPSGLQYEILETGSGAVPAAADTVRVHYRASLLDGTTFDSTYERGAPASFPVAQLVPGLGEALARMPVGSRWKLYLRGDLAYGEAGKGDVIGPNATVVYEVELLSIEPPPIAATPEG